MKTRQEIINDLKGEFDACSRLITKTADGAVTGPIYERLQSIGQLLTAGVEGAYTIVNALYDEIESQKAEFSQAVSGDDAAHTSPGGHFCALLRDTVSCNIDLFDLRAESVARQTNMDKVQAIAEVLAAAFDPGWGELVDHVELTLEAPGLAQSQVVTAENVVKMSDYLACGGDAPDEIT